MESLKIKNIDLKFRSTDGKVYFTVDDLKNFPEFPEGPLLELISGELFLLPSPDTNHQNISGEIFFQIKSFLKEHPMGSVFTAPYDVVLSDESTVIPDIVFVSNVNEKIITSKNIQGSPDLIFEIVSTNRSHDFVEKRNLYEKYGVSEYILVDLRDNLIFQFLLNNDKIYSKPVEYELKSEIPIHLISGLKINIQ